MLSLPTFWSICCTKPSLSADILRIYDRILPYITDFLCAPHPNRKGAICPFVPAALKEDKVYFTFFELDPENFEHARFFVKECIKFFLNKKNGKSFNALIVLFPENIRIENLLKIHWNNKKQCIDKSLMIGALWDENQAKSLHNDNFFPLRTPSPILVIRDLTIGDLVFMDPKHYNIKIRLSFLKSFIKTFSNKTSSRLLLEQVNQAKKLKKKYELNLFRHYILVIVMTIGLSLILYKAIV